MLVYIGIFIDLSEWLYKFFVCFVVFVVKSIKFKEIKLMSIQPKGEDLRRAVKWVSEERTYNSEKDVKAIVQEACMKFDLSTQR